MVSVYSIYKKMHKRVKISAKWILCSSSKSILFLFYLKRFPNDTARTIMKRRFYFDCMYFDHSMRVNWHIQLFAKTLSMKNLICFYFVSDNLLQFIAISHPGINCWISFGTWVLIKPPIGPLAPGWYIVIDWSAHRMIYIKRARQLMVRAMNNKNNLSFCQWIWCERSVAAILNFVNHHFQRPIRYFQWSSLVYWMCHSNPTFWQLSFWLGRMAMRILHPHYCSNGYNGIDYTQFSK